VTARGVADDQGILVFVDGILRDITHTVKSRQERLRRERLQGVLEMAGGVVHRLNQPLTVVNNLLNELLADIPPGSATSNKLLQIREQVEKLNDIARKVGKIRKYKSMDYVAGVKIVDIDGAS
jgi:signal transduction histidine kinase